MPALSRNSFPEKPAFQRALLRWYKTYRRDLPWRENPTPYRIMVSEFMLQQTRVETVIPYYDRFLKLFPALQDLARAPLQKVLKAWAGLGYYARARNLHDAAKAICRELNGKIPATKEDLLRLPGFGPYTAGAVASLAFGQSVAALDGNGKRVLGRLFPRLNRLSPPSSKKEMETVLEDLIRPGKASEFNQALMDLGAMICIPTQPRCQECPIKKFCASQGAVQKKKEKAKKIREETWGVALIEKESRVLIHRNEEKGLLAGLWQFPTLVLNRYEGSNEKEALRKFLREDFGLRIKIKALLPEQEYFFTHIHTLMKPYLCSLVKNAPGDLAPKAVRWIKLSNLTRYPVSTAMRRIAALLKDLENIKIEKRN